MTDKKLVSVHRGWSALYRDLGIEPADVLRRAHLPEDLLDQDGAKLTVPEYFRLWNVSEDELDDPTPPIRLAEAITSEAFNPMVFAALCSANLAIAMRRIADYKRLMVPMVMLVESCDGGLFVSKRWDGDVENDMPVSLAVLELVLLVQIARIGLRERIAPLRVVTNVAMEPREAYADFFGVAPTDGNERSITFRTEDATKPFLTANDRIWKTFEPHLQQRLTKLHGTAPTSVRLKSILLESLPGGEASIDETARRLGMSARTLQRRLGREATSFKKIVRRTREELASHYLTNTQLSYPEIAYLIGFEEPSSFYRAFREWTGRTPESFRFDSP